MEGRIFGHKLVGQEGRTMQCSACRRKFHVNLDNPFQKGEECHVRLRAMYDDANLEMEMCKDELATAREDWDDERAEMDVWVSESNDETEKLLELNKSLLENNEHISSQINNLNSELMESQGKASALESKLVEVSGLLGLLQHEFEEKNLDEIESLIDGALQALR